MSTAPPDDREAEASQPRGGRHRSPAPSRPIVLVTGLSGAGKASILKVLEDLGFETVDNPPVSVLEELVGQPSPPPAGAGALGPALAAQPPLAAGIDTRTRDFDPARTLETLARLRLRPDLAVALVYATAEEAVLLRRYTETRRRHPVAPGGRVADGIAQERALLAPLRDAADLVVDTSELPLPALRRLVEQRFRPEGAPGLSILVQSFAFPRGLPREADLVFDLRFLRNPHYDPLLRPLTGRDPAVAAHVEADPDWPGFWARLTGFLDPLLPRYVAEGKKYLTVALGCTGGRHRSVLVAERLTDHLRSSGWRADVTHRELAAEHDGAPAHGASGHNVQHPSVQPGGREALTRTP